MKFLRAALAALFVALMPAGALAQSGCSIFTQGKVPTPGQWNQCLQLKQDLLGYTAVNRAGDAMAGRLSTIASTTNRAGFAVLPGVAPTAPVDGDIWTTTAGIFVRINGATVGPLTATGSTIPSVVQGDTLFASGVNTLAALAKNTTATRYIANTGTNNNPAWAQVDLSTGVTGALPLASLATGTLDRVIGYFGSTTASQGTLPNCTGALTYSTSTHLFGCNAGGAVLGTGTPTANQVAQWTNSTTIQGVNIVSLISAGGGISLTGTTTATIALANNGSTTVGGPANPTATSSSSQVMMGLGSSCVITPGFSSRVRFTIIGSWNSNSASGASLIAGRFGTGAAPANGAAVTGTTFIQNSISVSESAANQNIPFALYGRATGLTPGVALWFDAILNAVGGVGAVAIFNLSCYAEEF